MYDLAVVKGKVYFDKKYHNTNLYIKNGKIVLISPILQKAKETYDCQGDLVIPGIIDPHTHFQLNLGNMSSRDDFFYGTKAAAFGGVTTIIDFIDPIEYSDELETAFHKRVKQAKKSVVDYKLHACVKNPKDIKAITSKMKELGLNTVKLFTTYSDSNRRTYDEQIRELLLLSRTNDFLVTAHIENDNLINLDKDFTYKDLLKSRPTESETTEALKLAELVRETKGYLYMVHLSSGITLTKLQQKYPDILNTHFFIESCPHYFTFTSNELEKKEGYLYTLAPPLRTAPEVQTLRENIDDVFTIGTDHCSFNMKDKKHLYLEDMPLGIGGIEYSFHIMYQLFGDRIIDKMTKNVAQVHKLYPQKGIISEGSDADLFIYHLEPTTINKTHGFADYNLYKGMEVKGEIKTTISNGQFIVKNGKFFNKKGKLLNKAGE